MSFINKYFDQHIEYPSVCGNILPHGEYWEYISSTFINGFLNYYKPISCFAINRYTETQQKFFNNVDNFIKNKVHHTKFNVIDDDVLFLGKSKNNGEYILIWMDCDVSDCCIGRFITDDPEEVIIYQFKEWVIDRAEDIAGGLFIELPVNNINGWVGF